MSKCEAVLQNIKNMDSYLTQFGRGKPQSAAIECLFAKALAHAFHLPFHSANNDDKAKINRVLWNGQDSKNPVCSDKNSVDAIVYARNFDILLEITRRTGSNQCTKEFSPSIRHLNNYLTQTGKLPDTVRLLLIVPEIHIDTFNGIRHRLNEEDNMLVLTYAEIAKILEVCAFTTGLRHGDIKNLIGLLINTIKRTEHLSDYSVKSEEVLTKWRRDFLDNYRLSFLGLKGYNTFKEIRRQILTASEIQSYLILKDDVKEYFNILGRLPTRAEVTEGLLLYGFGFENGQINGDPILSSVDELDIERRFEEIITAIKMKP